MIFVIGAGLSGLSAAVELAARGEKVVLIEASAQAGGRCRSYVDPVLGMTIDNGNHLVVSGNHATFAYLRRIGSAERMIGLSETGPSFHDRRDGANWTLKPNPGPIPWWVLAPDRRVKGTRAADYLSLAALLAPPKGRRIGEVMACEGVLWERLMGPFLLAALNTDPAEASADLASAVIRRTFAKGGAAYESRIAHPNLSAAFIEPALAFLAIRGGRLDPGTRLREIVYEGARASALVLGDRRVELAAGDAVVLAAPPWIAADLVPGLTVPSEFRAIVNAHYAMAPPAGARPMVGVIGGAAEWVFAFPDRLSVTVSGADAIVDDNREDLARRFWTDVAAVHGLTGEMPAWQVVKERRATFAATPEQNARRPGAATRWENLFLAGDWTDTGLPGTIEGSIQSGALAASLVQKRNAG